MINLKKISTKPERAFSRRFAEKETARFKEELFSLQNLLFAGQKYSLLIIMQGMDASGKDGTIRHVFTSMNPMGVNIKAFKNPNEEEKNHDFLWRVHPHAPAKGMISVFNRSQYEDILVPTVHRTLEKKLIEGRYEQINDFEKMLVASDTIILKFFLHISKEEQKKRIKERQQIPHKKWKYDKSDSLESKYWDEYTSVYENIIKRCSHDLPWIIVPADNKWYRNYVIAREVRNTLVKLKMKYPLGNASA
jgi:PPK2 family polyphosphate:nucleotide phosphotransferase